MNTILNNLIPNRKVEVRIIKEGFSSPVLGHPNYIGKVVTLNASTANRFLEEGIVELVENDAPTPEKLSLADALAKLDHADDKHWTQSGLPDLNVLKKLTGKAVKRAAVPEDIIREVTPAPDADTLEGETPDADAPEGETPDADAPEGETK